MSKCPPYLESQGFDPNPKWYHEKAEYNPHAHRKMKVSREWMKEHEVPLHYRDYCAHLWLPLHKCQKRTYYSPWHCKEELHTYEKCQYGLFMDRVRAKVKIEKLKAAALAELEKEEQNAPQDTSWDDGR